MPPPCCREVPVGLIAIEDNPSAGRYNLWRFMLGRHHQRRGYGRAAVALLVSHVRTRPNATCLLTTCARQSRAAADSRLLKTRQAGV